MASDSAIPVVQPRRNAGALTFALLFSLESLVRSLNSTVLSLQAYQLLGSGQAVSVLATCVSLCVLASTLMLPYVLGRVRRRFAYTFGVLCMIAASLAVASFTVEGQAVGSYLRNCGAAVLNISLSLYILDNIRRADLAKSEPLRLSLSTFSWMVGPATGVWLFDNHGPAVAQVAPIVCSMVLLAVFWWLRLADQGNLPSGTLQGFNPLANVSRFVSQPRLRLAWTIAFGRSVFWSTFFIYGPLMIVEGNLPKQAAGLMISASQLLLLGAWAFGKVAERTGVRPVIGLCFVAMGSASIAAGFAGSDHPYIAMALLLLGSLAASGLDGVGGIPFLRAVRYHERQRMAAVYRTFLDFSELIPGMVFAVALRYFQLPVVFIIMGLAALLIGSISWRYLPKSL